MTRAQIVHARLRYSGVHSDLERRRIACEWLGREPVASLNDLTSHELGLLAHFLSRWSDAEVREQVADARQDRERFVPWAGRRPSQHMSP